MTIHFRNNHDCKNINKSLQLNIYSEIALFIA